MLKVVKVQKRLKELSKAADRRAEKQRGKAVISLSERKGILSDIVRATAADLKGIGLENGQLVFDDESVRNAVRSRAQIVMVPDPNWDPKSSDGPAACPRVPAVLVDLSLEDRIKAIQELNKMDGVYKDMDPRPAEIHIHAGDRLQHDEQTAAQLDDPELRVPMLGTAADQSRYRKVGQRQPATDPFAMLKKSGLGKA
jgi:hypothetical protein